MNACTDLSAAIELALARMIGCPDLEGVVVATSDGLVLACAGSLNGDAAAACAAALCVGTSRALETLEQSGAHETVLWNDQKVWYQTIFPSSHLLLAVSRNPANAGALRLAVRKEFDLLRFALDHL